MGRDELKSKAEPGGFVEYGAEQLPKVDSMRRDKSQPDFHGIPILSDGAVMLCSAEAIGNKPTSCSTCTFHNAKPETCMLMGPEIIVDNVTGAKDSGDPIEYWPCCSEQNYGEPNHSEAKYIEPFKTPDALGLVWINAPEVGQEYGGSNCGGVNGGDDCDHYLVRSGEKWDSASGFCRVLQHEVDAGQVCSAWDDDDILDWQDAQQLLRKADSSASKKRLAKQIIGKDE